MRTTALVIGVYCVLLLTPVALVVGSRTQTVVLSTKGLRVVQAVAAVLLCATVGVYASLFQGGLPELLSGSRAYRVVLQWDLIRLLPVLTLGWVIVARGLAAESDSSHA
jgi:hypothetical protein